jgi:hypothetical protein
MKLLDAKIIIAGSVKQYCIFYGLGKEISQN